jgi:hypothetical protein
MEIVYSHNPEPADSDHIFINLWMTRNGTMYKHVMRDSVKIDSKFEFSNLDHVLPRLTDTYDLDLYTSIVRGLNTAAYEEGEDFEDVDSKRNYLNYIYMFGTGFAACLRYGTGGYHFLEYTVVYNNHTTEKAKQLFNDLDTTFSSFKKAEKSKNKVNFICQNRGGLYLQELNLKNSTNFDLENHYNDDFVPVSKHIIDSLNKSVGKGIILLHGKHGTGKTSYLRHLIKTLDKNIIYVSPDMSSSISQPSFLTFLLEHKNSILIIEDAENVIKTREAGENQAVANLLNVTDGILGDGLNFQVICTFNTGFDFIDPALKRKGRMIAQYEFNNLCKEKTQQLVTKLYGEGVKPTEDEMSLAEIFNMHEDNYEKVEVKRAFGFNQ